MAHFTETAGRCSDCKKNILVRRRRPNHILHLLLCIPTAALWGVIWGILTLDKKPWECSQCGSLNVKPKEEVKPKMGMPGIVIGIILLLMLIGNLKGKIHFPEGGRVSNVPNMGNSPQAPAKKSMTEAEYSNLIWVPKGKENLIPVLKEAGKQFSEKSECLEITDLGYAVTKAQDPKNPTLRVECKVAYGNGYDAFYPTKKDVIAKNLPGRVLPIDEQKGRKACEDAIRVEVAHPSTLDIHTLTGYSTHTASNGNRSITQKFTAQNSFGVKLKHEAYCLVMPDGTVELTVNEVE